MTKLQFIVLLLFISWIVIENQNERGKQTELIEQRFNQLDSMLEHRSRLDSLYWNHLEECAFELKNGLTYSKHN